MELMCLPSEQDPRTKSGPAVPRDELEMGALSDVSNGLRPKESAEAASRGR